MSTVGDLALGLTLAFDESKHPRDHGKFTSSGGSSGGSGPKLRRIRAAKKASTNAVPGFGGTHNERKFAKARATSTPEPFAPLPSDHPAHPKNKVHAGFVHEVPLSRGYKYHSSSYAKGAGYMHRYVKEGSPDIHNYTQFHRS